MVAAEYYDITIWEEIRYPIKDKTAVLVETIKSEIAKDDSLREFQGEYPVPWQLTQIIQQRAERWMERLYALSREIYESRGKKVSDQFDRALWAYHIDPFVMREVETNESGYKASVLFELLLCAVGCPSGKRNQLKVGQKDCCLDIRNKIHQLWHDKLHHLAPRIELAAAIVRAQERAAMTIPVTEPPQRRDKIPSEENPPESKSPTPQPAPEVVPPPPSKDVRSESSEAKAVQPPETPTSTKSDTERNWGDVQITFLSDERVQIRVGKKLETRNYAEFGFDDGRTGSPNSAWKTLRRLAELRGAIASQLEAGEAWPKVEKRMQEIRSVFRKHFGISSDPLPFVESSGYKALFKIECGPSYRS